MSPQRTLIGNPEADLMSPVPTTLQAGRLRIAPGALVPPFEKELLAFRQKVSAAGRTQYDNPRREGEGHGDLVMALALAVPNTIRKPDLTDQRDGVPLFP